MYQFNKLLLLTALVTAPFISKAQTPFYDYEFIDVNNIKAAVSVHGDLWHTWNNMQLSAGCEFPKGSGKHMALAGALWMGGFDQSFSFRAAATAYRDTTQEYWPGPLQGTATSITYQESEKWARIWKVDKADIQSFLSNSSHTTTNTPAVVLEWPAKGNTHVMGKNGSPLTITDDLAPFVDANSDGVYNALDGDYPQIKGDQMLWYVFNDAGPTPHTEFSMTEALGVQIAGSIYGYSGGPQVNNIVFYEFDIKNTSQDLDSFVVGTFADMDLGYAFDDYIGFDSSRNMAVVYNGDNFDGAGESGSYGDNIPVTAIKFLQLPNSSCSTPAPLGSFMYFNSGNSPQGDPTNGLEVYGYLNATWRDGSPLRGPSSGFGNGYAGNGTPTHYVFDGRNMTSGTWSECDMHDPSGDRRFVLAAKPQTFNKGDHIQLSFALIATDRTKNNGCPTVNMAALNSLADYAQQVYCNPSITGINSVADVNDFAIYPNPVNDQLTIQGLNGKAHITVHNVYGQKLSVPVRESKGSAVIDTRSLPAGIYLLSVSQNGQMISKKFTKL